MGKVAAYYYEPWTFRDFNEMKALAGEPVTWGDEREAFLDTIGTALADVVFYNKPKRLYSAHSQMELYFDWMARVGDRRTRRIIAAQLIDYWKPVPKDKYDEAQAAGKKRTKTELAKTLEFKDLDLTTDNKLLMNALADDDPPSTRYIKWIQQGTEEEKAFAVSHGTIGEALTYFVQETTMGHWFYTLSRAKKHLNRDFSGKVNGYHNTSMVYGIPAQKDFKRSGSRVTEYCLLFAEMDYYKLEPYKNIAQKDMLSIILQELDQYDFPHPTEVIFSRGLHLVWRTNPIPAYRAIEWEILQKKIYTILKKFGMDKQTVTDKVRLLRLVGTVHSKTGKKIFGQSYTADRYRFDELLQRFCAAEVEQEQIRRQKARKRYAKAKEQRLKVLEGTPNTSTAERKQTYTTQQDIAALIYEKYLRDLFVLVEMREGKLYGNREFLCFLVRWFSLVVNQGNRLKAMREMEKMFNALDTKGDYTLDEIEVFTRSAQAAYDRFKENWSKGYNYKNTTLVEHLDITPEEQKRMKILIGKMEKTSRHTERKRKLRGSATREEYQQGRKSEKEHLLGMLKKQLEKNPKAKRQELADFLRVSVHWIDKLKKELKSL